MVRFGRGLHQFLEFMIAAMADVFVDRHPGAPFVEWSIGLPLNSRKRAIGEAVGGGLLRLDGIEDAKDPITGGYEDFEVRIGVHVCGNG